MKNKIKEFLLSPEFYNHKVFKEINDDTKLLELGIIESLNVINLVLFLESTFSIELNSNDLLGNNFTSINSIEQLVQKKLAGKQKNE